MKLKHSKRPATAPKNGTFRRLLKQLMRHPFVLLAVFLTGLLAGACMIAAPYMIGVSIDMMRVGEALNWSRLGGVLLILIILFLLNALFQWLLTLLANRVSVLATAEIRKAAFDNLSRLSLSFVDSHPSGDFVSRLTNDADAITDGLNQLMIQLGSGVLTMVGSLVVMLMIDARAALAAVAVTPLIFVVTSVINRNSVSMYRRQAMAAGELNAFADETIAGQVVARSLGAEPVFQNRFKELNSKLYVVGQKAQFYSSLTNPGARFVNNIAYVLVGILACLSGLAGTITVGKISSLLSYVTQFAKPVNEFAAVSSQFQNTLAGCERLFELIDAASEDLRPSLPNLVVDRGEVKFDSVSFSYVKGQPWIKGLDLHVPPRGQVAIVGPTGAGKTTLVNLLMNFYALDSGRIVIDDADIQSVNVASLRQSFGMVLQDSWLFSGTVRANIAYGRPDASDAEVVAAARAAYAHDLITRLPKGYDTVLTDNGAALSVGEKQLLTIARAFLTDPHILILDEATSNIDTRTERLIQRAFDKMMRDRTSFVIAHRLSTVRDAHLILVMQDGRIVQKGAHDELVKLPGLYRSMYKSQFEHTHIS
ncbi:MAG: ABC transporter ATP-binding protein [Fastidiosipilaceae bacterium]|jgi:ATP-binding cassette subfamily B multidrug efflux pump